jgi:hypothetical protein
LVRGKYSGSFRSPVTTSQRWITSWTRGSWATPFFGGLRGGRREKEYSLSRKIERREEVNRSGSSPAFDASYESTACLLNATATRCVLSETTAVVCLLGCEGERYPVNCV